MNSSFDLVPRMNMVENFHSPSVRSSNTAYPTSLSRQPVVGFIFVSLISAAVSPGSSAGIIVDPAAFRFAESKTDAGLAESRNTKKHLHSLAVLRQLTGLTWDQIGKLFGVSRRAVHFWANGKTMTAPHHEHLERSLSSMKAADKGNAPANRQSLFVTDKNGVAPFDLLVQKHYVEFVTAMGTWKPQKSTPIRLATIVSKERLPIEPTILVDAIEEPVQSIDATARRVRVHRI
ncbi:hypothetical protein [Polynucleobacter rarus]|uniref:hypothetical protein n=1 Tax=Polynucleobacter rarus TaxID=556055 RepID=UPI00131F0504|nr:hypothetical protein [Polynucleobacter rarus]